MPRFRTTFNGYSVKFSPFDDTKLAVATAQNFGIIGNGRLHVLQMTPGGLIELAAFDTADGLYDCAWSEDNENILLAACADGSVKVYDLAAPPGANPLRLFHEHRNECCSLSWNLQDRSLFLSSSWDDTIKLHSLAAPGALATFTGHQYCVYQVAWSPHHATSFLSASGDTTVRLWDTRQPPGSAARVLPAHAYEVLCADWCKYNDAILATGSIDKTIRVWDVRAPGQPLTTLHGHGYAVRRVLFSPHTESLLASCSYDMTVKLWDTAAPEDALRASWGHHTEFAIGLDWSLQHEGLLASTGWDEWTWVWHQDGPPG